MLALLTALSPVTALAEVHAATPADSLPNPEVVQGTELLTGSSVLNLGGAILYRSRIADKGPAVEQTLIPTGSPYFVHPFEPPRIIGGSLLRVKLVPYFSVNLFGTEYPGTNVIGVRNVVVDRGGETTLYFWGSNDHVFWRFTNQGLLKQIALDNNSSIFYHYIARTEETAGIFRLESITDQYGNVTSFAYVDNVLHSVQYPGGYTDTFSTNMLSATRNETVLYNMNSIEGGKEITDPYNGTVTKMLLGADNSVSSISFLNSSGASNPYRISFGYPSESVVIVSHPYDHSATFGISGTGAVAKVVSMTSPSGSETRGYNELGQITTQTVNGSNGSVVSTLANTYDSNGLVLTHNENGVTTTYTPNYQYFGLPTQIEPGSRPVISISRNSDGRVTGVSSGQYSASITYNANGCASSGTEGGISWSSNDLDGQCRPASLTYNGVTETFGYNSLGALNSIAGPEGTTSIDVSSQSTTTTQTNGSVSFSSTVNHDGAGNTGSVVDSQGTNLWYTPTGVSGTMGGSLVTGNSVFQSDGSITFSEWENGSAVGQCQLAAPPNSRKRL